MSAFRSTQARRMGACALGLAITLSSLGVVPGLCQPGPRADHSAIFDPVHRQMVIFGGTRASGDVGDAWALSVDGVPAWTPLASCGPSPYGRSGHVAVFDAARDRMLVLGGGFGGSVDVWALALDGSAAWTELTISGTAPSRLLNGNAIYDPVRERVLVFGGLGSDYWPTDELWALSLAGTPQWKRLRPAGLSPGTRAGAAAIYDPVRDRMLLFGGRQRDFTMPSEVWALSLGGTVEWRPITINGPSPAGRYGPSAIYDAAADRVVICGGNDGTERNDVWALSLSGSPFWTLLPSRAGFTPPGGIGQTAVFDPSSRRMLVFGGSTGDNTTWSVALDDSATWTELIAPSEPGWYSQTAIYDAPRDRMVTFGGGSLSRGEVWVLPLSGAPRWERLAVSGRSPGRRTYDSALYDPVGERMLVYGGQTQEPEDLWSLSLSGTPTWEALHPAGAAPPARWGHTAVYDAARRRMLVFGGVTGGTFLNDVWALSLSDTLAWEPIATQGTPPAGRQGHGAIYDTARDRMVVVGGATFGSLPNDVWELPLATSTWHRLDPFSQYELSWGFRALHDPRRDRLILFGNPSNQGPALAMSLGDYPVWYPVQAFGLAPQSADVSAVYDSTRDIFVVQAPGTTTMLDIVRSSWIPFATGLGFFSSTLSLPTTTVGDTTSTMLTLHNSGWSPIGITSIELPRTDLQLSQPAPFTIPGGQSIAESLSFVPREPFQGRACLVVRTDDDAAPPLMVPIAFDARALNFRTRALGDSAAPIGEPLAIVVTPETGVHIESGRLFYRTEGLAQPFESIPLAPSGDRFIALIPREAVTEQGLEYYVEVRNGDFTAVQPLGAPTALFHQAVAAPTVMTALARPTTHQGFLAGREIVVEVRLPPGAEFISGTLHHRRGGEAAYRAEPLRLDDRTQAPFAVIPDSMVDGRGVEFWVEAQTRTAHLTDPAFAPGLHPEALRITVPRMTEPSIHPPRRYRLVSTPLDLGSEARTLADMLGDEPEFGPYDPARWRSFRYLPSGTTVELAAGDTTRFRPVPGRAFWLISRSEHRVDTAPLDGFSTPTESPFPIPLEPGWNAIGNPFAFAVAWSGVSHSASIGVPVAFDPGLGAYGDYADDPPARLEPFEGYFVENRGAAAETLWVPARAADSAAVAASPQRTAARDAAGWTLRLRARTAEALDGANQLGVAAGAEDGVDAFDRGDLPAPPGPWVSVGFAGSDRPGLWSHDIRSVAADGHTWDLEVRSSRAGEPVDLEVLPVVEDTPQGAGGPDAPPEVRIVDREQRSGCDVTPADGPVGCRLLSSGPTRPYRLALIAGSSEYVARAAARVLSIPSRLTFDPIAPNPARGPAQIRFGLPRSAPVQLQIFDLQGQRVGTLLDGAPLPAGDHTLMWNGAMDAGRRFSSGIYFVDLRVGGERITRRLVMLR